MEKQPSLFKIRFLIGFILLFSGLCAHAQMANKRLILKDGSYQIVTQYKVVGDRVRYYSAERAQWEELPAALVDFPATEKWAREHVPGAKPPSLPAGSSPTNSEAAAIDEEEREERADQSSRTPQVAQGLHLPDEDGVWAFDTFRDQPELVALEQNTGDVNHQTGHNVLRSTLNPLGGVKQTIQIPGAISKVQLHVSEPTLYVSLSTNDSDLTRSSSTPLTVETHGAGSAKDPNYSSPTSRYAIVRVQNNMKKNFRVVSSVKIGMTGGVSQTENIVPITAEELPGKHWLKLTPVEPLTIGDYALMEILAPGEVNLSVWDFRIDPQGPDNKNAIIPLQRSSP